MILFDRSHARRLLYVEYRGELPFDVGIEYETPSGGKLTDGLDFEWCERDECLYYDSAHGGGSVHLTGFVGRPDPPVKIWISDDTLVTCNRRGSLLLNRWPLRLLRYSIRRRLERRPARPRDFARLGYERISEPLGDPFEDAFEGSTVYCTICEDRLPEDEPCEHLEWEDGTGWVGPGAEE